MWYRKLGLLMCSTLSNNFLIGSGAKGWSKGIFPFFQLLVLAIGFHSVYSITLPPCWLALASFAFSV